MSAPRRGELFWLVVIPLAALFVLAVIAGIVIGVGLVVSG